MLSTQLSKTGRWSRFTIAADSSTELQQPDTENRLWCFFGTWRPSDIQPAITAWSATDTFAAPTSYSAGDHVRHNSKVYYARQPHTVDAPVDEPGAGSDWETWWGGGEVNYVTADDEANIIIPTQRITAGTEVYVEVLMMRHGYAGACDVQVYDTGAGTVLHTFSGADVPSRTCWVHLKLESLDADGANAVWRKLAGHDPATDADVVFPVPAEVTAAIAAAPVSPAQATAMAGVQTLIGLTPQEITDSTAAYDGNARLVILRSPSDSTVVEMDSLPAGVPVVLAAEDRVSSISAHSASGSFYDTDGATTAANVHFGSSNSAACVVRVTSGKFYLLAKSGSVSVS
jgi:hypothetical protein